MAPKVNELTTTRIMTKKSSPLARTTTFHDILATLIGAFPDDGSVSAKTVELRDLPTQ